MRECSCLTGWFWVHNETLGPKWRKRGLIGSKDLSQAGLILVPECPNHGAKGI